MKIFIVSLLCSLMMCSSVYADSLSASLDNMKDIEKMTYVEYAKLLIAHHEIDQQMFNIKMEDRMYRVSNATGVSLCVLICAAGIACFAQKNDVGLVAGALCAIGETYTLLKWDWRF